MRIKYEVSAGGLLLRRRDSTYDALLIGRGAPPRVWTLPKGHVEARETTEQAGIREVREETGCWGEIITKLSEIAYWFYVGRAKHRKAVTFYLMRYLSGDPANHDHEVDDARWFDVAQAPQNAQVCQRKTSGRSGARIPRGQSYGIRRAGTARNRWKPKANAYRPDGAHSTFTVRIEAFDGPLDLLLTLIKEQQLDIATVPLASMAEQYLNYVRTMEARDVEIAAEYLVIAATLIFLKSKALLPPIPTEFVDDAETPEEVEEHLRRRLIAYSKYREFGEQLREHQNEASSFYYRPSGDPAGEIVQRYDIDPEKLKRAFIAMLAQARPEKRSIARERVSLIASMDYIMRRIKERGEAKFSDLCEELGMTRDVIVVTFLAILELIRRHRVAFEQTEAFDDIRLFAMPAA